MTLNMKYFLFVYFAVVLLSLNVFSATADFKNVDPNNREPLPYTGICNSPLDGKNHEYTFTVKLKALANVTFDGTEMNLLKNEPLWKKWTFQNSSQEGSGWFNVVRYDAGLAKTNDLPTVPNNWDDNINSFCWFDYDSWSALNLPPGYILTWIQIIHNNYPEYPSPHIDPYSNNYEDGLPFYFSSTEMNNNLFYGLRIYPVSPPVITYMSFYDSPCYPFSVAITHNLNPVQFEAHLYAAIWNQSDPGTVIVYYNGLKWGYEISWTQGKIVNPVNPLLYKYGGVAGDEKPRCDEIVGSPLYGSIGVSKYGPAYAHKGDTITYTITVSNPSSVTTMYKVSVVDSLLGDITGSFGASLAPSMSESETFIYTVPSVPISNTVTVTYKDALDESQTASASWTIGTKLGDLNFDGVVNYWDAYLFRQAYIIEYNPYADFNKDGVINYKDASLFRGYYIAG